MIIKCVILSVIIFCYIIYRLYLKEYFKGIKVDNPYAQDEKEFRCVSVSANGDLLGGNIYNTGILEIIDRSCP